MNFSFCPLCGHGLETTVLKPSVAFHSCPSCDWDTLQRDYVPPVEQPAAPKPELGTTKKLPAKDRKTSV